MKVHLSGELRSRHGVAPCRIHDVSRGGVCLDAERAPEIGEAVTFERRGLKVGGTIVWSRGKRFGVRFDAPIRATELLVQMSESRMAQVDRPGATAALRAP